MKSFSIILFALLSLNAFASERVTMDTGSIQVMNLILDAQKSDATVKKFIQKAKFSEVRMVGNRNKTIIEASGYMVVEGDIMCGTVKLRIEATPHVQHEMSWMTYESTIDSSGIADYCEF